MKYILLFLFFISFNVHAAWVDGSYEKARYDDPITKKSWGVAYFESTITGLAQSNISYPYYVTGIRRYASSVDGGIYYGFLDYKYWDDSNPPDLSSVPDDSILNNHIYTDEQCESLYGSGSKSTGIQLSEGDVCSIPSDQDIADQECEAVKPTFITLPNNPGSDFTWDYNGCTFTASGPWLETPSGEFTGIVTDADGVLPDPDTIDENDDDIEVPDGFDSSDNYTETDDPDNDCKWNSVSFGGKSYCYVADDASTETEYDDGSTRVDHYDGSYEVTDSAGTTTQYNADGTKKGTAPTGSGQGSGGGVAGGKGNSAAWSPGDDSAVGKFDSDGTGEDLIQDARERLQDAYDDIKGQIQGKFSTVSAGGSCTPRSLSFHGSSVDLDFCSKITDWGSTVRAAVLLVCGLISLSILMRSSD